jgi:acyl-coenzyme A synthetase/AMP-(fatty) acid ligase
LSPGYWRDEKQTAKVFVRNPFAVGPDARIYRTGDLGRFGDDGLVYFAGRADSQIKSRGYRIELGEIEAALNALTELRESAAVGVPTEGFEGIAICCAYVPRPGSSISPAHLRQRLSAQLPSYMLPARWLELEELPKNVNGKIDRKLIRERFASESAPQAERPAANAT